MIHKLRNSYGGGDVTYVDYILTDENGIDHLVKSEYRDFHNSESFFGDKPLGFHKNAFWAQNQQVAYRFNNGPDSLKIL